jgi:hypothetical protein
MLRNIIYLRTVPFLPGREDFHPKRNQGRQKLATLPTSRFEDLSSDVYFELSRRCPEFKENVSPSGLPTGNTGAGQSASGMIIPTKSTMEEEYIEVPYGRELRDGRKWLYTGANMQHPGSHALSSLLAMLNDKKVCNITTFQHSLLQSRSLDLPSRLSLLPQPSI